MSNLRNDLCHVSNIFSHVNRLYFSNFHVNIKKGLMSDVEFKE